MNLFKFDFVLIRVYYTELMCIYKLSYEFNFDYVIFLYECFFIFCIVKILEFKVFYYGGTRDREIVVDETILYISLFLFT